MRKLRCDDINDLLSNIENARVEFKSKLIFDKTNKKLLNKEGSFNLASSIVALINRFGGLLLIGIDDEQKIVESGSIDNYEVIINQISAITRNQISPPVLLDHELINCKEGDVIALHVPRREAIPHSVKITQKIGKKSIHGNAYYVRTDSGKRQANDLQVAKLFEYKEFPHILRQFPITYTYPRQELTSIEKSESSFKPDLLSLIPRGMFSLRVVFGGYPRGVTFSKNEESGIMSQLMAELFPYAVLDFLSWNPQIQWATRIEPKGGAGIVFYEGKGASTIKMEEIAKPKLGSMISQQLNNFGDFPGATFLEHNPIRLPPNTKIAIDFPENQGRSFSRMVISSKNCFKVQIEIDTSQWQVGIPYNHPSRIVYEDYYLRIEDPIGTINAQCKIHGEVFVDYFEPLDRDYYDWVLRFVKGLQNGFDFDVYLNNYPDPYLLRLERILYEIKEKLG